MRKKCTTGRPHGIAQLVCRIRRRQMWAHLEEESC